MSVIDPAPGRPARTDPRAGLIDADVHPALRQISDLRPFLSSRVWDHLAGFGPAGRTGLVAGQAYPKSVPGAYRQDAGPPEGGPAGSDLAFMQSQYLDPLDVRAAILSPLGFTGQQETNPDVSIAICRAMNDWQVAHWTSRDRRLKASVVVPIEQPEAAAAEIARCADLPDFAQVLLLTRTADPLGRRRYWPIYRAAAEHGLPVGIHVFGSPGHPPTPAGWPSFYFEEMVSHSAAAQGVVASLVLEGVFQAFPTLSIISVEGAFAWLPALEWRLDRTFDVFRAELPHLKRKPSEYLHGQFFLATQPIEEPERRGHLLDVIQWVGPERLLFSTDYPHWDFDDPRTVLPARLGEAAIRAICSGNALSVYRGLA